MDTRDLLQAIYKVKPGISPEEVHDYTLFFEKHDALPEDRLKEVHEDLYKILGDLSQVDEDSAYFMKHAMAEAGQKKDVLEDVVEDFPEGKYLPGGAFRVEEYEKIIRQDFEKNIKNAVLAALKKESQLDEELEFKISNLEINGLAGLQVDVGKPRVVYTPYSIITQRGDYTEIRNLFTGEVENTNSNEGQIKAYNMQVYKGKQDGVPLPGSKVNKQVVSAKNVLFYPKVEMDVVLEFCEPPEGADSSYAIIEDSEAVLPVYFRRQASWRSSVKKHKYLENIVTSEKWVAKLPSKIEGRYEFHCTNHKIPALSLNEVPQLHLYPKNGGVNIIDKTNAKDWINTYGALGGLVFGVGGGAALCSGGDYGHGILLGIVGTVLCFVCAWTHGSYVDDEKSKLYTAMINEWEKSTRYHKLF